MNRLKFLVFALIVLGLWAFHLLKLSPQVADRAAESVAGRTDAATLVLAQQLNQSRAALQTLALQTAQQPAVVSAFAPGKGGKAEPFTAEKFAAIQKLVVAAAPESQRAEVVTVVHTEAGSFASKGEGAPVSEGVDFAQVAKAGAQGVGEKAFDAEYGFLSFPISLVDPKSNEVKTVATVAVGLPQARPDVAPVAKALNLAGLGLLEGGKLVAQAGSEDKVLAAAAQSLKAEQTDVVSRGSVSALGPVKLPAMTHGDAMGGQASLLVGSRKAIAGTSYEAVALAAVGPSVSALADYQQFALMALAGLLLLSLVWLALINNGPKQPAKAMVLPERPDLQPTTRAPAVAPAATVQSPVVAETAHAEPAPLAMPELPPAPEASPDDFQFPNAAPSASAPPPPMPFDAPSAAAENPFGEDESTRAYPAAPGSDPFAPPPTAAADGDFNPEATRVAMVPSELLQQAKANTATARPSPPPPQVNPEEQHWQDVYREFVTTREKCGEPADGLTYDKFKVKLQKNREQLIAKYNCRTVRFQVYVKEGKAALKATPVKD